VRWFKDKVDSSVQARSWENIIKHYIISNSNKKVELKVIKFLVSLIAWEIWKECCSVIHGDKCKGNFKDIIHHALFHM
jgi:hypothetical protein